MNKYEAKIREGPTIVCVCCGGLWFPGQTKTITREMLLSREATVEFIQLVFNVENTDHPAEFCDNCSLFVKHKKVPRLSLSNGLKLPEIPEEIKRLNRIEERLVAARHVFQSIYTVLGVRGQYKSKGAIVNVPVSVDKTVSCIPRLLNDTNIIQVKLKRRLAQENSYMAGNVNIFNVWAAAHVLKDSYAYKKHNVTIRNSNETLHELNNPDSIQSVIDELSEAFAEIGISVDAEGDMEEERGDKMNPGGLETLLSVTEESTIPIPVDTEGLHIASAEGSRPLRLPFDKDVEYLAFPTLFGGAIMEPIYEDKPISYASIVKSWARNCDRRMVRRNDFLLFMDRKRQLLNLASHVTIVIRMSKARIDNPLCAHNILENDGLNDILKKDQAFQVLQKVRSSPAYWKKERGDVMAMVRQLGIPTLFVTLSAAEAKWPELLVILKKVVENVTLTEDEANELSNEEKARLIQSDPITCARYFDRRMRTLKNTWKAPYGPFGDHDIKHYYYRIEFQHRGSPHAHMLLWLENAPELDQGVNDPFGKGLNRQSVAKFIDSMMTCNLDDESNDEAFKELILSRQVHRHTRSCFKYCKNDKTKCRFNIPFFPMDETLILDPLKECEPKYKEYGKKIRKYLDDNYDTLPASELSFDQFIAIFELSKEDYLMSIRTTISSPKVFLKRRVKQTLINNHNSKILRMHRANIDIQFILDPYACCAYVVEYINKSDKGTSEHLLQVLEQSVNESASSRKTLQNLASAYYNISEVSAQEAAYNILQISMCESSVKTVFIATGPPEYRRRILKSKDDLEMLDRDSKDIYNNGMIEYFAARPEQLEELNLAQFVAYYEYSKVGSRSNRTTVAADNEDNIEEEPAIDLDDMEEVLPEEMKWLSLKDGLGFIKKRKVPKVLRYHLQSVRTNPDVYFYSLLMLYLPWRNEEEELGGIDCAAKFEENSEAIMQNRAEFSKIDDESIAEFIAEAEQFAAQARENEEGTNAVDEEESPETVNPFQASDGRIDGRGHHDSTDPIGDYRMFVSPNETPVGGDEFNPERHVAEEEIEVEETATAFAERYTRPDKVSDVEFQQSLSKVNLKQRAFLNHVIDHVRHDRSDSGKPEALQLFVTGGAGTGKSMLIKTLYQALVRYYDEDPHRDYNCPTVLLTAPTGKAAYNISGQTLHSAFHLPVNHTEITELSSDVSHSVGVALAELKVVIIDEISMVSSRVFSWVDKRLKDTFNSEKPFGGLHVIIFGDFLQLPPVMGSPIYARSTHTNELLLLSLRVQALWSSFKVFRLIEIMRQRDDALFATALNNMAMGVMTIDDIRIFTERTFPVLPPDQNSRENKLVQLYSTNNAVSACNEAVLATLNTEAFESVCFDRVVGSGSSNLARQSLLTFMRNSDIPAHKTMGLSKVLTLKIDARYMITNNIDTSDGLVNGTTGTLKKIMYGFYKPRGQREQICKAIRIWLLLDEERSGKNRRAQNEHLYNADRSIDPSWTSIDPVTLVVKRRMNSPLSVKRTQFPVVVSEAMTIHKSQGSTYQNVAVNLEGRSLSRSLLYVACSRATSASGLYLVGSQFRAPKPPKTTDLIAMELQRQSTVVLITKFDALYTRSSGFNYQLMFHNIQSLNAHLNQIINDQAYLVSDFLLFAETWTTGHQTFTIPGFVQAARVNVLGETPRANGSICWVKSSLLEKYPLTQKIEELVIDDAGHKMAISAFILNDVLIASIYRSPRFSQRKALDEIEKLLTVSSYRKIIAGDFNSHFDDEQNPFAGLFNRYGLTHNMKSTINSTTKYQSFIDNIFTDISSHVNGRYISFTSYHDPLFMQFDM